MNIIGEITLGLKLVGAIKEQLTNLKNKKPLDLTAIATDIYDFSIGFYPQMSLIVPKNDFQNDIKTLQDLLGK